MNAPQDQVKAMAAQAAAEWFARHRAGVLAERERAEFVAWLRAAPANMSEYLAIASLSADLRSAVKLAPRDLRELIELGRGEEAENVLKWKSGPPSGPSSGRSSAPLAGPSSERAVSHRWSPLRVALAVMILPIMAGAAYFGLQRSGLLSFFDGYRTAHGEQRTVNLQDGSTMHLNSESRAVVHFSTHERLIEVEQGQVLFNVAHDRSRRFRVHAGVTDVVALGTQFDVYRQPADTVVTVVDGVVEVYNDRKQQPPPAVAVSVLAQSENQSAAPPLLPGGLRVVAGKQVRLATRDSSLPVPADADVHKATAWLQREIVFDEEPLGEVVAQFNRYGQQPIQVIDERLRGLRISGIFNAYDAESFLKFVSKLKGVEIKTTPTQTIIQASGGAAIPDRAHF